MRIRSSRMFMTPVLSSMYEDYINCSFNISVKAKKSVHKLSLEIEPQLNCESIINLINNNKAEVIVHFECQRTRFRTSKAIEQGINYFEFPCNNLNENLQIVGMIVAKEDIYNYSSQSFNANYEGAIFNIEKGTILGISDQLDIPIEKNIYDLSSVDSIVAIKTNHEEQNNMIFELTDKKIVVKLPEETFISYYGIGQTISDYTPIIHMMFIIPAISYALEYLRNVNDWIEIDSYLWFKVIKKKCEEKYKDFSKELIETKTSIVIAQELIESPVDQAIKNLIGMGN